jgi:hypothetical protein
MIGYVDNENAFKDYFFDNENMNKKSMPELQEQYDQKTFDKYLKLRKLVQTVNGVYVYNCKLAGKRKTDFTETVRLLFDIYGITYDFENKTNVIFFARVVDDMRAWSQTRRDEDEEDEEEEETPV